MISMSSQTAPSGSKPMTHAVSALKGRVVRTDRV